jgi:membrane protein DedA with SNARE-associated domain
MTESDPTAKTFLGFVLLWIPALVVVAFFGYVLFASDHPAIAILVIVLAVFLFFRHSFAIGRRMRGAIRRRYGPSEK